MPPCVAWRSGLSVPASPSIARARASGWARAGRRHSRSRCNPARHATPRSSAAPRRALLRSAPDRTGLRQARSAWRSPSPFLEQHALHGAAEVAVAVGEARGGEADRIGPRPGLGVQKDPITDRLARQAEREVAVDEGPFLEVEH